MAGLARICKLYGSIKVNDVEWVYDYAKEKTVLKSEMSKEDWIESEKAKYFKAKSGVIGEDKIDRTKKEL
jgi:hypothetical protein